jgi:hypothetical protein
VLTPVCGAPPLRLRLGPAKARLKIDERLQILLQEALLGKLGDDDVKALGSEQGLVLALRLARMDLAQRSERRTKAIALSGTGLLCPHGFLTCTVDA